MEVEHKLADPFVVDTFALSAIDPEKLEAIDNIMAELLFLTTKEYDEGYEDGYENGLNGAESFKDDEKAAIRTESYNDGYKTGADIYRKMLDEETYFSSKCLIGGWLTGLFTAALFIGLYFLIK